MMTLLLLLYILLFSIENGDINTFIINSFGVVPCVDSNRGNNKTCYNAPTINTHENFGKKL